jgi:hypothetical protein
MTVSVVSRVSDDALSLRSDMIDERAEPSPGAAPVKYYEMTRTIRGSACL